MKHIFLAIYLEALFQKIITNDGVLRYAKGVEETILREKFLNHLISLCIEETISHNRNTGVN
jgi:hypothetical protein